MDKTMSAVGWGGTLKGDLTAAAMARNRTIADRLGCLDAEGMALLRRGNAPTIRFGPYTGEKLTVDHIIPRAVSPTLDLVLANLELMPNSLNLRKGSKIGQRQIDLANKLLQAGLLSSYEHEVIVSRRTPGFVEAP
jgi:5-methylcytosine-specific restriction endonuclease McrA